MVKLTKKERQARREYQRQWRKKKLEENPNYFTDYMREWRSHNKQKVKEYEKRYWQRKVKEQEAH